MDLLKRPELGWEQIRSLLPGEALLAPEGNGGNDLLSRQVLEQVEIEAKYAGYISRQDEEISRLKRNENTLIPEEFDYQSVEGLSSELKQKLSEQRPRTLARAARIPGVTPAAISLVLVYLKKRGLLHKSTASA